MRNEDVFLYLLGAGASRNVLPLASQFSERLTEFAKKLRMAGPHLTDLDESDLLTTDPVWGDARRELAGAIEWLAEDLLITRQLIRLPKNSISGRSKRCFESLKPHFLPI
jgi:hypothetical protein